MAWRFLVVDGADEGRAYALPAAGSLTIGNGQNQADVSLNDLYVARIHCEVRADGSRWEVADQSSSRGTFVNGQRIDGPRELHPGDVLRVGNSHLRLEAGEAVAEPPPRRPAPPAPVAAPAKKLPVLPSERLGELAGQSLGHFHIGHVLGRGHCGTVFRALDQKDDKAIALKVLAPLFPHSEEEMQTFVRAMKAMLPLHHPNLVGVLGAGKTGPYCWIALDLVEGSSLCPFFNQAKLSWKRSLRVAIHIARALSFARQHRLVHGNITPNNILIGEGDNVARLADLMLSTALEGSQLQLTILEDKLMSELPYLAPEQTPGEGAVDSCTDIHALGAVVYALLTGHPPFEAKTPDEIIEKIRSSVPVRPRKFLESTPNQLEAIVLKMLAKRPEDRYLSPAELLAELEPLAESLGVKV